MSVKTERFDDNDDELSVVVTRVLMGFLESVGEVKESKATKLEAFLGGFCLNLEKVTNPEAEEEDEDEPRICIAFSIVADV